MEERTNPTQNERFSKKTSPYAHQKTTFQLLVAPKTVLYSQKREGENLERRKAAQNSAHAHTSIDSAGSSLMDERRAE